MGCSLPGSSVLGILQERILEWVPTSFSRGFSWPRNQTWVSCIAGRFFTNWATREALCSAKQLQTVHQWMSVFVFQIWFTMTGSWTTLRNYHFIDFSKPLFIFSYWENSEKAMAPYAVFLPGESHGRRSLVGGSPWGREELDKTERLDFHFSLSHIGEGNGNPLQCSCLENLRDGGAW